MPDLDDLIEEGMTLSEALAAWSAILSMPKVDRQNWKEHVRAWLERKATLSAQALS